MVASLIEGKTGDSLEAGKQRFYSATQRRALTDKYESELLDRLKPLKEGNGNFLIVIGGGQLCGKTVVKHLLTDALAGAGVGEDNLLIVTNDIFKKLLPEYEALKNIPDDVRAQLLKRFPEEAITRAQEAAYPFIRQEADNAKLSLIKKAHERGIPILVDDQMTNLSLYRHVAQTLPDYLKVVVAPHITPETMFDRGPRRAGRRFLPEEFLHHHKSFEKFIDRYEKQYDIVVRLDNNVHNSKGEMPRLMALTVDGDKQIFDEVSYEEARRKRDINIHAKDVAEVYAGGRGHAGAAGRTAGSLGESHTQGRGRGQENQLGAETLNPDVAGAIKSFAESLRAKDREPASNKR